MDETDDIYTLFQKVKDHPKFLFGTIFTEDDLEGREPEMSEDFPYMDYDHITDRMVEAANDALEDLHPPLDAE